MPKSDDNLRVTGADESVDLTGSSNHLLGQDAPLSELIIKGRQYWGRGESLASDFHQIKHYEEV